MASAMDTRTSIGSLIGARTMRAYSKMHPGPGEQFRDVPVPADLGPDDVLIRVAATSICGTDLHIHLWDGWSANRVRPPRTIGHEFAGHVLAIGPHVSMVSPGDYVTGESHWVCGSCIECRLGQAHVCAHTRILGVDVDGCFAEYVVVPQGSLWKNPPQLPLEIASIQDPLGNAVHAVMSGPVAGCRVAVLGCGPVGLFTVAVARASGASIVLATDVSTYRMQLATKVGADRTCLPDEAPEVTRAMTGGEGFDGVLEMSGSPDAIRQAMTLCRRGGRVTLMGIPARPVSLDVAEGMIFKGLTIQCVVGRRLFETWRVMSEMLGSGHLDISPIITHQLRFSEMDTGMALMKEGKCGKVVFRL